MKKIFNFFIIPVLGFLCFLMFFAVFNGTVLWLAYPYVHVLFPVAAENGIIATDLTWSESIFISSIFTVLIKSNNIIIKQNG